jgi:hypothetical protein
MVLFWIVADYYITQSVKQSLYPGSYPEPFCSCHTILVSSRVVVIACRHSRKFRVGESIT